MAEIDEAELVEAAPLAFPVVPIEDDPYPPEEGDPEGLIGDLEELIDAGESEEDEERPRSPAIGMEPVLDWTSLEFFRTERSDVLRVEGPDAVVEWATKAVNTPRGVYPIYSSDYGSNLQDLLGQNLSSTVLYAEVARSITECLLVHPRIVAVDIESVRRDRNYSDALFVDLTMTIDGEEDAVTMELVI
jgi:phage baseplate assembly protein W